MGLDAGSVIATLGARVNPTGFAAYDSAMKKAIGNATKAEAANKRATGSMGAMGSTAKGGLAGGVLAAGAALVFSVKKAADYEQQLSKLESVSGATARQMKQMSAQALQAGADTKFSALDAAKAQTELAKGGMSVKNIMGGGLKAALALAAAGDLELADAASYTANAMNLFGIKGQNATHVADALANAANTTTADVSDFGMALVQGGAAAKQAGLTFDETVVALEALASVGVKGSDAGTSLKAALIQLIKPTAKQAEAAKAAGISFLDQHGRMKSLSDISGMLRSKTEGMTKAQRAALFATLAGTDGFRTLAALYDTGPSKLDKYAEGVKKQGTAAEVAAKKQDNLKGKVENLQGSVETAAIQLGKPLLKPLTDTAEEATDALGSVVDSGALEKLGSGLATTFGILKTLFMTTGMGGMVKGMIAGFTAIAGAVSSAQGPMMSFADFVLGVASTTIGAMASMADAANAVDFLHLIPDNAGDKLRGLQDDVDQFREHMRATQVQMKVDVILTGDMTAKEKVEALKQLDLPPKQMAILLAGDLNAQQKLDALKAIRLEQKVMKVLTSDAGAKEKLNALKAMGLPNKIVKVLANAGSAIAQVAAFKAIVAGVPPSKVSKILASGALSAAAQVRALNQEIANLHGKDIAVNYTTRFNTEGSPSTAPLNRSATTRAAGRGRGDKELALTGEGSGREAIVDGNTGRAVIVDRPTFMELGPEDYVIPNPKDGPSASLLRSLAKDLGIPGFAKGKKGGRYVPKKRDPYRLPVEDVEKARDTAREKWQRDVQASKDKDKNGHLTKEARKAKARIARDKADYVQRKKEAATAKAYAAKIKKQEDLVELSRLYMDNGNKHGDSALYNKGTNQRKRSLKALHKLLVDAQKHTKFKSPYWIALQKQISQAEIDESDRSKEHYDPDQTEPELLNPGQKKDQDRYDAAVALAALTEGIDDDKKAAGDKLHWAQGILDQTMFSGNNGLIAQAATMVKQAKDDLAGLTSSTSPDVQAQLDQEKAGRAAEKARADASDAFAIALAAGSGNGFSGQLGAGTVINVNTLHPGDPTTLAAIGGAAAKGASLQKTRSAPRAKVTI